MQDLNLEFQSVQELCDYLNQTQYVHIRKPKPMGPIMTKADLQKIHIPPGVPVSRTSGTTGIPVVVPKTPLSSMWFFASNVRELSWRKWDPKLKTVVILARIKEDKTDGIHCTFKLDAIQNLQQKLDQIQPYFLFTYPSIIAQLDLSKERQPNLIDIRSVGEPGGTNYSCEEAGTIAIQCPQYPQNYHIMENIVVESDPLHGILITDLTNPVINRYALGDHVELSDELCKCRRKLPLITKINGRSRNMLVLPDGDRVWPTVGEPRFREITNKILQHQCVQISLTELVMRLKVSEKLSESEEENLIQLILSSLNRSHLSCRIEYVTEFPFGKFEAFKSELK